MLLRGPPPSAALPPHEGLSAMYRDRDAKADLVEFMQGAVPRYQIKWGHLAAGAAIGYFLGREIKKLGQ